MSDTKEILDQILHNEKLLNSRAFKDRVYTDEPIIRTASQLIRPSVPDKIKEMKGLAFTPEAYWKTSAWLFYNQGRFMEDYEDNFSFADDFVKYYPSYRDLSTEQLRGYFTWRSHIRNGIVAKAPLPFVYIYLYELINCIGYGSPDECFDKLKFFCDQYSLEDDSITRYTNVWMSDFVVYYGLSPEKAAFLDDIDFDRNMLSLIHWDQYSDDDIYLALSSLSAYRIEKSLFYSAFPEDFRAVLTRCFITLAVFFRDKRKNSLCDKLFGYITECSYNMFASAIFYDRQSLRSCTYELNEIHSFTCQNGKWKCRKYYGSRGRNGKLGDIIKAVDSLMREKTDFRHKISCDGISKTVLKMIQNVIDSYYEEKHKKEALKIEIDLSKLSAIRISADKTRDKLIVAEELPVDEPENIASPAAPPAEPSLLNNDETVFLKALLYCLDPKETAEKCGVLPSILSDSINEKLYDTFGDTVIDFSSDAPELIDDYTAELKSMFPL